ncbi:hypothetical protein CB1_001118006 [Camelus ferus]|nr:hypothetical protein CB1_001118006 [Camelus ferus]
MYKWLVRILGTIFRFCDRPVPPARALLKRRRSNSFTLSSEGYNRRPGGRRHSRGNPESSLMWKPQEQVVTEMISEEGGKGLRRPHCTVEEDMEKEISNALGHGPQDEILSSAFKLRITRGDIQTLKNCHWLNDEHTDTKCVWG